MLHVKETSVWRACSSFLLVGSAGVTRNCKEIWQLSTARRGNSNQLQRAGSQRFGCEAKAVVSCDVPLLAMRPWLFGPWRPWKELVWKQVPTSHWSSSAKYQTHPNTENAEPLGHLTTNSTQRPKALVPFRVRARRSHLIHTVYKQYIV